MTHSERTAREKEMWRGWRGKKSGKLLLREVIRIEGN
jgi:hypothetical protein